MCEYIQDNNQCSLKLIKCPFLYYCNKENKWKELVGMNNCKVKQQISIPKGYFKVLFERHGYLYIDMNGHGITIANSFNDIPQFVKIIKLKNGGIKLKKYEG